MIIGCGSMAMTAMRGGAMTPAGLTAALTSIYGAALVGLYLGEDMVLSGTSVTSWPGRVSGTLTYSPNSVGTFTTSNTNGRRSLYAENPTNQQRTLRFASGIAPLCVIGVGTRSTTSAANMVVGGSSNSGLLAITAGNWFTSNGNTYYQDGVASNTLSTGVHIWEACHATGMGAGFAIGGYYSDPMPRNAWDGQIACGVFLGSAHTPEQRAAGVAVLKSCYGIA